MVKKPKYTLGKTLVLGIITAAAIGASAGIVKTAIQKADARMLTEQVESSRVNDNIKKIQQIIANRNYSGQELLEGLGVNYQLSAGEYVELSCTSGKGAYVFVGSRGSDLSSPKGFVSRSTLEGFIENHERDLK